MVKPGFLKSAAQVLKPFLKNGSSLKTRPVDNWINDPRNTRLLRSMGIDERELTRLRSLPERHQTSTPVFTKQLQITSPFWHLHGLKELFLDETYKFRSETPHPLIIDCGSNIGLSIIYFKQLYPAARVIGFEPDPVLFELLKKNISTFNYTDVSLIDRAVWTENTSLNFLSDGTVGGSIDLNIIPSDSTHTIKTIRLRDFLTQQVDFLKIDIEGPEDLVLADCAELLGNVQNLFIEYHSLPEKDQSLSEILSILRGNGFRYYIKEAWENMHHPFIQKKGVLYDLQLNIFAYRV